MNRRNELSIEALSYTMYLGNVPESERFLQEDLADQLRDHHGPKVHNQMHCVSQLPRLRTTHSRVHTFSEVDLEQD